MNRNVGRHHPVHHPLHGAHHPNCLCPCHNRAANDFGSIRPAWNIRSDPRPNGSGIFSSPSSVNLTISNTPSTGRAKVRIHIGNNGHTTPSDTNDMPRGPIGVKRVHFDEVIQNQYHHRWDKWPKRLLHPKPAPKAQPKAIPPDDTGNPRTYELIGSLPNGPVYKPRPSTKQSGFSRFVARLFRTTLDNTDPHTLNCPVVYIYEPPMDDELSSDNSSDITENSFLDHEHAKLLRERWELEVKGEKARKLRR